MYSVSDKKDKVYILVSSYHWETLNVNDSQSGLAFLGWVAKNVFNANISKRAIGRNMEFMNAS